MPKLRIDSDLCDVCGVCVSVCLSLVLEVNKGKVIVVDPESCLGIRAKQFCSECVEIEKICTGCVACVRSCPTAAIEILEI